MCMKIDPLIIRGLRDERSWSQDHLAAAAGVSLRTIQRAESEGNISAETRLALAAAFGVDVAVLAARSPASAAPAPDEAAPPPGGAAGTETATPDAEAATGPTPGWAAHLGRTGFLRHVAIYVVVLSFLAWLDVRAQDGVLWFQWPLLGWGAGIASHGIRSWRSGRLAGVGRSG